MALGKFITFEGIEGAGKSTQIQLLAETLKKGGHEVLATREPGGTALGDKIRSILSDSFHENMSPQAELCLFLAARAQHVREKILPALFQGKLVLSDRFADASVAYQGMGRGLGIEFVRKHNEWVTDGLTPDLTIWLDLDPRAGLSRVTKRSNDTGLAPDRLDQETLEFYHKVRNGYKQLAIMEPLRIVRIQADKPLEEVEREIFVATRELLRKQEAD